MKRAYYVLIAVGAMALLAALAGSLALPQGPGNVQEAVATPLARLTPVLAPEGWRESVATREIGGVLYDYSFLVANQPRASYNRKVAAYDLRGKYDFFSVAVGLTENNQKPKVTSQIVFEVWVDGELAFQSPPKQMGDPATFVSVPVTGRRGLKLVCYSAERGKEDPTEGTIFFPPASCWGQPTVIAGGGAYPPELKVKDGEVVNVTVAGPYKVKVIQ